MKNRYGIIVSVFLAFTLIFSSGICMGIAGASPSLMIEPSEQISLGAGETLELSLSVDELPDGLSGYIMTVELDDPAVARIESVDFPGWASLTEMSELPDSSVWLKAADLQKSVVEGALDTELASLTLTGLEGGSTGITVTVSRLEDDSGKVSVLENTQSPVDETGDETGDGTGDETGDETGDGTGDENPSADESSEPSTSGAQWTIPIEEDATTEDAVTEVPDENPDEVTTSPENEGETSEEQPASQNDGEPAETINAEVEDTGENALPGFGSALSASIFVIMGILIRRTNKLRIK